MKSNTEADDGSAPTECPQCGGEIRLHEKQESRFIKCHYRCIEGEDKQINERSCHWESTQFKASDKDPKEKAAEIDFGDRKNWRWD